MPVILVDRLPLPSLRMYTAASVFLLAASVYRALNVTSDPQWRLNATSAGSATTAQSATLHLNHTRLFSHQLTDVISYLTHEPFCMWTLMNGGYCALFVCGACVRRLVFGRLRASETQRARDKLWNYVFYKFIFVFGVINVQFVDEVLLWCCWFTVLGSLQLLAHISRDRFEYLSFSTAGGGRWAMARLVTLLVAVLALALTMTWLSVVWGGRAGLDTIAFMAAECVLLALTTLHVLARCALHAYEALPTAPHPERRVPLAYYMQLCFETVALCVELAHHVHMLLWSNMFLSMASLVLLLQVRYLFHELRARLRRHRVYLWVLRHMDRNYPMASEAEVAAHKDHCAICWDSMETARKLPCQHLFHNSCLSSWLQQDASCPTCRRTLPAWGASPPARRAPPAHEPLPLPRARDMPNHLFHFDGSRYVSWLPSFSVEVTRVRVERAPPPQEPDSPQLEAMARQVHQMFPHYSLRALVADLRRTRSLHATVDNVLEGRLLPPTVAEAASDGAAQLPEPAPVAPAPGPAQPRATESDDADAGPPHYHFVAESRDPADAHFSRDSCERERTLRRRKEQMVATARRRYAERHVAAPRPAPPAAPHDHRP